MAAVRLLRLRSTRGHVAEVEADVGETGSAVVRSAVISVVSMSRATLDACSLPEGRGRMAQAQPWRARRPMRKARRAAGKP